MALLEDNTHVFIVRVWLEPRELPDALPEWRGVIEHVGTGERRYFRDLAQIGAFVRPYLEAMGVTPRSRTGWRRYVERWRHMRGDKLEE